ncbi:MAG: hypothetical protein QME96_12310 [Myxococcota bacterium]|nr:hypothetical protein [Myxococcota bacterium]
MLRGLVRLLVAVLLVAALGHVVSVAVCGKGGGASAGAGTAGVGPSPPSAESLVSNLVAGGVVLTVLLAAGAYAWYRLQRWLWRSVWPPRPSGSGREPR